MSIRCAAPDEQTLNEAVSCLAGGGVVVMPTETVYGLAGSTQDDDALNTIYRIKGRPRDNPLIAHVLDPDGARSITTGWDTRCDRLADAFWPGPLTMVLGRSDTVPATASGGRDTIAVRCPSHPAARALLTAFGGPISAPSANQSGSVSPTTAQHVVEDLSDTNEELLIIDGGPCELGIESTVVDLTRNPARILRPGSITEAMLNNVIGDVDASRVSDQEASPGTRSRHYATTTPIHLIDDRELCSAMDSSTDRFVVIATTGLDGVEHLIELPPDPVGYAEGLYSAMRRADALGVDRILVVHPGDGSAWCAVLDRLARATSTD
ncbi:MAG: L-threonylcarbamoyladenylate synthase [Planctomycetota bacterium]|nr:L-threonylcarbamoyladenylate synthase [Planctomycetota bacterium]